MPTATGDLGGAERLAAVRSMIRGVRSSHWNVVIIAMPRRVLALHDALLDDTVVTIQ